MPKKKPQDGKPQVHKDLDGLEISINEFGEIVSNIETEKLNHFLNKHVDDKKLRDRDDIEDLYANKLDESIETQDTDDLENLPNIEDLEMNFDDGEDLE